jgi:hypothetical protein
VATLMPMPEAAVDENGCSVPRKNKIRFPREAPVVQSKPEPQPVQRPPEAEFRLRVCPSDAGHHARTGRAIHHVSHGHACQSSRKLIQDNGRVRGA